MKTDRNSSIRDAILRELYFAFSKGELLVGISDLSNSLEKTEAELYEALVDLHKDDFSSAVTNDSYKISPEGVIYVENNKLVPDVMVSENRALRRKMLDEFAIIHEKYKGSQSLHVETIADTIKSDVHIILNNADALTHLGFIAPNFIGDFKITDGGLWDIKNRREQQELSLEFRRISEMKPHQRGREFQEFIAKLASREGWRQEVSLKTSNEEIDIILFRNREFLFVECKWENKPIEASVVRDFYGKLDTREGVVGIIISMSGFTKGAIGYVESQIGKKIILLFGSGDINSIVNGETNLEDLINEKHRQLITRKIVLVS